MFYFRIDRVRFLDNGGVKPGLGIFGHDFAKVKFLSFVTRSDQSVPDLDEWMQNNDAKAKKATLQTLVSDVISTRGLTEVESRTVTTSVVRRYRTDPYAEEIPKPLTSPSVRRGFEAARDVNEILREPVLGRFQKDHSASASLARQPGMAGIEVAKFVAQTSARRLMNKGDRELGAVVVSFIRPEHYPQGIRESHDVHDMTGNMFFDYTIFGYKRALPVIREKKRKRGVN